MKAGESAEQSEEWFMCQRDPVYFIDNYCKIYDATAGIWLPFKLWDAQKELVRMVHRSLRTIVLKARQLGISWIGLAYGLYLMIFKPIATVSIVSKDQDVSNYLLGKERLKGIYDNLPKWMQCGVATDNEKRWALSNGSIARAFPSTGGDAYTVTYLMVDEADLIENQRDLFGAIKPTVDGGGKLFMVSRANSRTPQSDFKRLYHGAVQSKNGWSALFLPWMVRPGRTQKWYNEIKREIFDRTSSYDELHEMYPATAEEAMSGRTQDRRIPPAWLSQCHIELPPQYILGIEDSDEVRALFPEKMPIIPGLHVYKTPEVGEEYTIGADPSEGNSHSDPSSTHVVNRYTGEEVARFSGICIPETHAVYTCRLSDYYHSAPILVERNNHGHAFILQCRNDGYVQRLIQGNDKHPGWQQTESAKVIMYDIVSVYFRETDAVIHSYSTFTQLLSIEAKTQRAPEGEHDDEAISYVLAQLARARYEPFQEPASEPAYDIDELDYGYRFS